MKGCWNAELSSALDTQLYQRYLVPLGAPVGVYLVGMFDKAGWDVKDPKKRKAPDFYEGRAYAGVIPTGIVAACCILGCALYLGFEISLGWSSELITRTQHGDRGKISDTGTTVSACNAFGP